jgi:hypothetical protein
MPKINCEQFDYFGLPIQNTAGKYHSEKSQKTINHIKKKIDHQNKKKIWKNRRNVERIIPILFDQTEQLYTEAEINASNDFEFDCGCYCYQLVEYEYYGYSIKYNEYTKRRAIYTECDYCKMENNPLMTKNRKITFTYTILMPWGFEKVNVDKFTY